MKSRLLPGSLCLVLSSLPATAQVWTNATNDGLWSTAGNWSTGVVPSGTSATATFTTPGTSSVRLDGADSRSCSITFGNGTGFTIGNASGDTARLISAGRTFTVSDSGSYTIQLANGSSASEGTLEFGAGSNFISVAAGGKLTLDGRYNGLAGAARNISKTGTGTLELTGNHPDSLLVGSLSTGTMVLNGTGSNYRMLGMTSVSSGALLKIGSAGTNLLTGTSTLHASTGVRGMIGTLDLNGFNTATTRIDATNITAVVTNNGTADATLTLGDFGTTTGLAASVTNRPYNGFLQDGATNKLGLTMTGGTGSKLTLTLGRTPTYTGATQVTNGSTLITPGLASASAVTVSSTGTLRNTRGLASTAALTINAGTLDVRDNLSAPSLSLTDGTLRFSTSGASDLNATTISQTNGSIELDVVGNTADRLVASGTLSFSGSAGLLAKLHSAPTSPVELAVGGTLSGSPTVTYSPAIATTRLSSPSVSTAGDKITLSLSGTAANLTWTGSVDGKWDLATTNWNDGIGASAFFNLDRVVFGTGPTNLAVDLATTVVPSKVTVNGDGTADYTFSGSGGIAGAGEGFVINDSWVSLGGNNTFVGPVTLENEGRLKLTSTQALGLTSGVTVNADTQLDLNGQNLVGAGRYFSANIAGDGDGSGAVTNTGASLFAGSGNSGLRDLTLSADASVGSTTAAATFDIGTNGSINGNGFKLTKKGTNEVIVGGPATNVEMIVESGILGAIFDNAFGSTLRVKNGGTARFTSNTSVQSCNLIVETGGILGAFTGNGTFTGTVSVASDLTINIQNTSAVTVNFTQPVSVPGNLLRNGSGSSGGASTFEGGFSVGGNLTLDNGALVTVGNGGASPTFSVTGSISMAGAGTGSILAINRSDAFNWNKDITGTGILRNLGSGTMTVLANLANTSASAALEANGGDVILGNGGTTGSATSASVSAGRTLTINRSDDLALTGALRGTGTVVKNGAGAFTLGSVNGGFSGIINVTQGSLVFNATNATAQGATAARINLSPGTTLTNGASTVHNHIGNIGLDNATWTTGNGTGEYNGENYQLNGDVTVTGSAPSSITRDPSRNNGNSGVALLGSRTFTVTNVTGSPATDLLVSTEIENSDTGTGTLVKTGPGTMEVTIVPSHTGGTTVSQGTLVVPGLPSGAVSIASGATLTVGGTVGGAITAAGTLAPAQGIGTLTVNNDVTLTGVIAVEVNASSSDLIDVIGNLNLSGSTVGVTPLAPGFTSGVIAIANSITGLPSAPAGYNLAVQTGAIPGTEELVLTATGTPPNNFASWLAANAPGQGPADDHDKDGVRNAVEFFMGESGSGFTTNPPVVNGKVTWPKDPTALASYVVQTSTDLAPGNWQDAATGVTDTGTSVEFDLPENQTALFVRLKVVIP